MTQYKFGCNGINRYAYDVLHILEAKNGSRIAENMFQPLVRFVNIAPTRHIKNMLTYNPGKIAAICERQGSTEDIYHKLLKRTMCPYAFDMDTATYILESVSADEKRNPTKYEYFTFRTEHEAREAMKRELKKKRHCEIIAMNEDFTSGIDICRADTANLLYIDGNHMIEFWKSLRHTEGATC